MRMRSAPSAASALASSPPRSARVLASLRFTR